MSGTPTLRTGHQPPTSPRSSPKIKRLNTPRQRKITKNPFLKRESRFANIHDKQAPFQHEFIGFYNLFVVSMVAVVCTAELRSLIYKGTLDGLQEAKTMFERLDVIPSWLGLVAASYGTYFLVKAVAFYHFPVSMAPIVHGVYTAFVWISYVYFLYLVDFPHVQRCFLLMELFVLSMKMHSYYSSNMELRKMSVTAQHDHQLKAQAIVEAQALAIPDSPQLIQAEDVKLIEWPNNISIRNYFDFLLVPTLCYEMEYPRTAKIRWSYVAEKLLAFVGIWVVIHVMFQAYFVPGLRAASDMAVLEAIGTLAVPSMLIYLLLFYIVFEVLCNGCAELTQFGDREFYSDWWNSTTFEEFARKWNKPVHEWLLRHVYLESIASYKVSSSNAAVITFLFSSVVHEFFMAVVFRVYKPWLFCFQMFQLPLIFMGRNPHLKGKRLGNFTFWAGMLVGPPMISLLYCRDLFREHPEQIEHMH